MTKYREILRLSSLGLSQQSIADSCNASKKTVNRVLKHAKELQLYWHLPLIITEHHQLPKIISVRNTHSVHAFAYSVCPTHTVA